MMPPPCTACTRSPRQQRAPPALHQRAASSRPAARRAARACSICPACTTTTASRSAPPRPCKARRRRGQILHLTGYSFASRGKAKRLYTALSIPQPPFFPGLALGCPPRRRHAAPAPPTVCGLPDEADGPPRPHLGTAGGVFSAVRVRKRENFLGMRGFSGFPKGGLEKARGYFLRKFLQ